MTVLGDAEGTVRLEGFELTWGSRTDVGHHRRVNEDSIVVRPPLFAVADGMGGHAAGDTASALAVSRLEGADADERGVRKALIAAALDVDELSDRLGVDAGTTATGVLVEAGETAPVVVAFNVGDSRVYAYAGGRLDQVTVDHSVVQELVDRGELDEADAEAHPAANVITRALGFHEEPRPDVVRVPVSGRTRLVLCSDGLSREIDREHLRLLVGAGLDPRVTAEALVDAALAAGGHDNVSVIVVDVSETAAESTAEHPPATR